MKKTVLMVALSGFVLLQAAAQGNARPESGKGGSRYFPHPEKIRFDERSLIINGKETFIYSGTFHYFRCPKELWNKRFQTIKDAGFNSVETYIPWNRHETQPPAGLDDFSQIDLSEFNEWLALAESYGFYVIVRPGPFICAEYDRGGYPGWLTPLRPEKPVQWMWFRSDDPLYTAWTDHWMKAFCRSVASHQVTRRAPATGGVILFQVENEYSHVYFPAEAKINALRSLVNVCVENGIEVPLIACESPEISESNDPVLRRYLIETQNHYPSLNVKDIRADLQKLRRRQPDAPLMTTELQGGWFALVWNPQLYRLGEDAYPDNIPAIQAQNIALYCIENGQTMLNFYMLFGGTNLDNTDSKDMQTSYDYGAAIREHGGTGEKYRRLKAIGDLLKEHGENLIHSTLNPSYEIQSGNGQVDGAVRTDPKGNRYIFIRNNDPDRAYTGVARVKNKKEDLPVAYRLEPFDSKVFYLPAREKQVEKGVWYPQVEAKAAVPAVRNNRIAIREMTQVAAPLPSEWTPFALGKNLLQLGIYDNRYVYYKVVFNLKKEEADGERLLRVTYPYLNVGTIGSGANGTADEIAVCSKTGNTLLRPGDCPGDFLVPGSLLKEGENEFYILYENAGYPKEFVYMEKAAGITGVQLLPAGQPDRKLYEWQFKLTDARTPVSRQPEINRPDTEGWQPVVLDQDVPAHVRLGQRGIFSREVELTAQDIQSGRTALHLSQSGDISEIYVNGTFVARVDSRVYPVTVDLGNQLKAGNNRILIFTDSYDLYAPGGIARVRLTRPLTAGIQPSMIAFSEAEAVDDVRAGFARLKQEEPALLHWVKIPFDLPSQEEHVWQPCLLTLLAQANGKIFLNGHAIGRFWGKGQQKEFYLPECWLKFGAANEILLQTKSAGKTPLIQTAAISFDPAFTEIRGSR
jgi:hypothetical protein